MEQVWLILLCLIILISFQLFNSILYDAIINPFNESREKGKEGFTSSAGGEDIEAIANARDETKGMVKWLDNKDLYDKFYASIYDQLTQGSTRTQAEIGLILHEWTKQGESINGFEVLDAGCGTGIATATLSKMDVKRVVGFDSSEEMLKQCKVNLERSTLSDEQKKEIVWRKGDLIDPSACSGGEFTHACLLYFTVYYFADKETLFRNLFFWVKPGGRMVVQVVNKHKFDPMLDSSAPWIGFSLQKYSDKRITKSEVVFNKFKYTGEFDLQDPLAEFRETFRFKDGKVRRQKHTFRMEDMNVIVGYAKAAGWDYIGNTDLTPIAFEYAFHLHFKHP
jgi:ubiquinone/menaquinone biosynthesis C-methylase UbiE